MGVVAVPSSALVALLAGAMLLAAGLAFAVCRSRTAVHLQEQDLTRLREELHARSEALAAAEREIDRLKRIPKAEALPMLQLAHELRSPLAAVQNALDVLLQGYATTNIELQNDMLQLARDRADAMLARVNDFLRLGALRHAEIERQVRPVRLQDVVRSLAPEARVRARWRAVDVDVQVPDSLPPVMATYEDMEHLLSNLINNAIKYTEPGSRVTVTLKEDDGSVVGLVEDTGIGIPKDELTRIFEEFYRGEAAKDMDAYGSGLGLSIVKRIVDLYGGRIDVQSELGKGSTFRFVFPGYRGG